MRGVPVFPLHFQQKKLGIDRTLPVLSLLARGRHSALLSRKDVPPELKHRVIFVRQTIRYSQHIHYIRTYILQKSNIARNPPCCRCVYSYQILHTVCWQRNMSVARVKVIQNSCLLHLKNQGLRYSKYVCQLLHLLIGVENKMPSLLASQKLGCPAACSRHTMKQT